MFQICRNPMTWCERENMKQKLSAYTENRIKQILKTKVKENNRCTHSNTVSDRIYILVGKTSF